MKRLGRAFGVFALALALSSPAVAKQKEGAYRPGDSGVAATAAPVGAGEDAFRFVVVGDRTGGHRPGVFEDAIASVDALRPDFVLNIGDLIEGNSEDRARIGREWDEIDAALAKLGVRFFYVPGNHDLTNDVQREIWRQRYGPDYYSFSYKGVLFLILNTEDPPQPKIARKKLLEAYGADAMRTVLAALQGDPAGADAVLAVDPRLAELAAKVRASENVAFSPEQVAMARRALERHRDARWTFVLMHRPAWKVDSPAFREIEAMLKGRPHTILAGHYHKYDYEVRGGTDYIQLGTTGGAPGDPDVVDHIMWVAMDGANGSTPRISNVRLDGLFTKQGPRQAGQEMP